ncbi:hypothetical protein Q3G72_030085 [Acer saccharum]|nr:hypothetical protein Q3G72_030085 [Acer saccharum]
MGQVRIKEAITEAFAVRDHRSKRARKHNLPSLKDAVWHLKKLKKGDDEKLNASSNPLISPTTGPHQGSAGMQNYRNHASSSNHKGGFSTAEEIVPNLASQPLSTSTGYPVNSQGVQSNSNFHPPTNGVSGQNSSQSNEHSLLCSPNYNPLMTVFSNQQ